MAEELQESALRYHEGTKPGKLEIRATKPLSSQRDLALAYSPGVAAPCESIVDEPLDAAKYTARSNLVAVISNGTAVLGLGDIGALASKPVMEGKAVLFKKFADVDVFDIEIDEKNIDDLVDTIARLEPTFGGINLEDIKAPECFYVEKKLKERMNIPVFHDDQHGTAIVTAAAVLNGLQVVKKDIESIKIVCSGAGAAAIACLNLIVSLGAKKENIIICDRTGVVHSERDGLDEFKQLYIANTNHRTLADAMVDADLFLGLSAAGAVSKDMAKSMAAKPIILAMANPVPEILPEDVMAVRSDAVIATGRSDYPNQVNNVLCFPFIFRGALDVGATSINEEMKLACVKAIADLAREEVPDTVSKAYRGQRLSFGKEYILPKPFDPRLISVIPPAVAKAAIDSGVSSKKIHNLEEYKKKLSRVVYRTSSAMQTVFEHAKYDNRTILYSEGEDERILHAAHIIVKEGYGTPMLIGRETIIGSKIKELGLKLDTKKDIKIIDPTNTEELELYANDYLELTERTGNQPEDARHIIRSNYTILASMMLLRNKADVLIAGPKGRFNEHLNQIKRLIGYKENNSAAAAMQLISLDDGLIFITDTYVNYEPDAETIKDITLLAAKEVREFGVKPKVALVSHSSFGSADNPNSRKMRDALKLIKTAAPNLEIDGEMQMDAALSEEVRNQLIKNNTLKGRANLLIMPNADAAHISYRALRSTTTGGTVGPILLGFNHPVHILNRTVSVRAIVNMSVLGVVESQRVI